jgi:hypothetical protein
MLVNSLINCAIIGRKMNVEFSNPSDHPEIDWEIHSFDDNCPSNEPPETLFELESTEKSLRKLKNFMKTRHVNQNVLLEGIFDNEKYGENTIVRFDSDFQLSNFSHFRTINWGIIANRKTLDGMVIKVLIYSREQEFLNKSIPSHPSQRTRPISIGAVEHLKADDGFQILSRINWIDIWESQNS